MSCRHCHSFWPQTATSSPLPHLPSLAMIALRLLPLSLFALVTSVSGQSMDGSLTRRKNHGTTINMARLPPTGLRSLHRRGLSIDLNEAPIHYIDLNEMADSGGEQEHHARERSSSHARDQGSPGSLFSYAQ